MFWQDVHGLTARKFAAAQRKIFDIAGYIVFYADSNCVAIVSYNINRN